MREQVCERQRGSGRARQRNGARARYGEHEARAWAREVEKMQEHVWGQEQEGYRASVGVREGVREHESESESETFSETARGNERGPTIENTCRS